MTAITIHNWFSPKVVIYNFTHKGAKRNMYEFKCYLNFQTFLYGTVQNGCKNSELITADIRSTLLGLALLTLSWDKNWDSHSLMNGYPSFYPRIALVAPSPGVPIQMLQSDTSYKNAHHFVSFYFVVCNNLLICCRFSVIYIAICFKFPSPAVHLVRMPHWSVK